jgi:hypothetical protein
MELLFSILNLPLWILLVLGLVLIYLIIRRVEAKKNEDFEDRDN